MPASAGMGRNANSGLRTPPRHDTITPNSKTVMELLRKAAPRCPGTGMVGRIQHLSEEHGSPLHTPRPYRGSMSHTPCRLGYSLLRIKQASYQADQKLEN